MQSQSHKTNSSVKKEVTQTSLKERGITRLLTVFIWFTVGGHEGLPMRPTQTHVGPKWVDHTGPRWAFLMVYLPRPRQQSFALVSCL